MKIVLDTNVLLSGLLTRGVCEALVDFCLTTEQITIVTSEYILDEFAYHAEATFGIPSSQVGVTVEMLRSLVELVEPVEVSEEACRDADDLPVLGTARAGKVVYLVTGDRDLQECGPFEGFSIVSPRVFYDLIN